MISIYQSEIINRQYSLLTSINHHYSSLTMNNRCYRPLSIVVNRHQMVHSELWCVARQNHKIARKKTCRILLRSKLLLLVLPVSDIVMDVMLARTVQSKYLHGSCLIPSHLFPPERRCRSWGPKNSCLCVHVSICLLHVLRSNLLRHTCKGVPFRCGTLKMQWYFQNHPLL